MANFVGELRNLFTIIFIIIFNSYISLRAFVAILFEVMGIPLLNSGLKCLPFLVIFWFFCDSTSYGPLSVTAICLCKCLTDFPQYQLTGHISYHMQWNPVKG